MLVILLRILLVIGLAWMLIRTLFRRPASGGRRSGKGGKPEDYDHLTDQRIDDAEFEELPSGDER